MTITAPSELSGLSVFAVYQFLQAHPEHKKNAMLIKDHEYPNMFFGSTGIEAVSFGSLSVTKPSEHTIKLYEFADAKTLLEFIGNPHRDATHISVFDSSSFIFIRTTSDNWHILQEIHQYLDEFSAAKYHIGIASRFTEDACLVAAYALWLRQPHVLPVDPDAPEWVISGLFYKKVKPPLPALYYYDPESPGYMQEEEEETSDDEVEVHGCCEGLVLSDSDNLSKLDFSRLYSLRVENVTTFCGVSAPQLRELALVTTPQLDGSAPLISSVTAPELRRLVIYYQEGVFPVISGFSTCPSGSRSSIYEDMRRIVEIVNVDKIPHDRTETPPMIDFGFLTNFEVIHLYGSPISILYACDMSKVRYLRLLICESQNPLISKFIRMPSLRKINLQVVSDNVILPRILTQIIHELFLSVHAGNIQIKNLWFLHSTTQFHSFYIYNSIKVLQTGHRPVTITIGELQYLSKEAIKPTSVISLIGVQIPVITKDSLTTVPICLLFARRYPDTKLIMRPVLQLSHGCENDLQVVNLLSISESHVSYTDIDFEFAPLFMGGVDGCLLPDQKFISLLPDFLAPPDCTVRPLSSLLL